MRRGRRVFSVIIICILITLQLVAVPVWAATSSDLKQQQKELEREKDKTSENYNNAKDAVDDIAAEQGEIGAQMEETSSELAEILASIDLIEEEIAQKEGEIAVKQQEFDAAKEQEQKLYDAMCKRIKYMYEKGDTTYVEIMMKATSFADLANKAEYAEQLYEYDRKQLENYVAVQQEAAVMKVQLEDEKGELETTQDELGEEQEVLQEVLAEYKRTYDDYDAELASARRQAAAYKQKLQEQTSQIAALDSQIAAKEKEEEAARKAAEEAARKANQKSSQSGNSSGSSGSGNGSSGGGTKSYAHPTGPATGSNIANFACQFVGNPYVFGGTSLTDGCDCSGFVFSVYKEFGISVPRSSYSLASAGTAVSYDQAQPGDVIVYPGHAAIYLGDGRIVHASSAKTGIKYGYATYRTITTIRRFV